MKNQQTRAHTHKVPPVGGRAQEAPPKEIWRDWKRSFQFLLAQRLCWFSIWIGNEAEKQTSQEWESQLLNFPFIFPLFFSFSLNRSLIVFVFNFSAFDDMLSLSNHIRYCRVLGWYLNFVWISPLICYSYFFNQNIWTTTTTTQNLTGCEMDMGGKSPIDADSLSLYLNIIFVLNKWGKEMERERERIRDRKTAFTATSGGGGSRRCVIETLLFSLRLSESTVETDGWGERKRRKK